MNHEAHEEHEEEATERRSHEATKGNSFWQLATGNFLPVGCRTMRKLGRILRRVLTALSLLLFVAVLAVWVRGYWSWDEMDVTHLGTGHLDRWSVDWSKGKIGLHFLRGPTGLNPDAGTWTYHFGSADATDLIERYKTSTFQKWQGGGILVGDDPESGSWGYRRHWSLLAFPCWMAAIVFGALPSWRGFVWWRAVRRRRLASRAGRCGVCGYDLRASPQRCPECGTAVGEMQKREARSEKRGENANIEH